MGTTDRGVRHWEDMIQAAHEKQECFVCGRPAKAFTDEHSRFIYEQVGFCQICQDDMGTEAKN